MPVPLALLFLVSFAAGVACGTVVLTNVWVAGFGLLLSCLVFFGWVFVRRPVYGYGALMLLCLSVGAARAALVPQAPPAWLASRFPGKVEVAGTIVGDPDVRETSQRLTVAIEGTRVIAVAERYPSFSYGDTVRISGRLVPPDPFETEDGRTFRYDRFLAKDGIFGLIERAQVEKIGESRAPVVRSQKLLYTAKHRFEEALAAALPEPHASLADGLIAGGKQGLGKRLLEAFTITGLLPIIVLSGYNVMIIAEAIMAALGRLPRRYGVALAVISISVFVLAAGAGSSAVRAALMAALALFARATRRTYDALRALAVVFVAMLLWNPLLLLFDPGFQFSFVATLGLIIASPVFEARLHWLRSALLRDVLATTLAAQLFVLPLLLYQTGNLSLVSVPANLLVLPAVPIAMALSALAGGIALLVPAASVWAGLPAYGVLSYVIAVAEGFARLPLAGLIIPAFPAVLLLPLYAGVWWVVWRLRQPSRAAPR